MNDLTSPGTQIVIIGTGRTASPKLPDVPAVATSVADLEQCLVERCGVRRESVRSILDPPDPASLDREIRTAAAAATDVFVLYYLGHGLISKGRLFLATASTADIARTRPESEALEFSAVAEVVERLPARTTIVVILDCCYSGRAELGYIANGLLLASAAPWESALAPDGARHTLFTGILLDILSKGDDQSPLYLSLRRITEVLDERTSRKGQKPVVRFWGDAGRLTVASNSAYRKPEEQPEPGPAASADDVSPYRGLSVYDTNDGPWFFGRDEMTRILLDAASEQMTRREPLIVVGASGVGKSSLLRAGLLPAIKSAGVIADPVGREDAMTPGADPMDALAAHLADRLDTDRETAHKVIAGERPPENRQIMLVVDQFEDLFIHRPEAAPDFVGAIGSLLRNDVAPLVVLGVRSDFLGKCLEYPELAGGSSRATLVRPMNEAELRSVIEEPAKRAGLTVRPELTELILREVDIKRAADRQAAVLPLLSHALLATWQNRTSRILSTADYVASGGVEKAIATTAGHIYRNLDAKDQAEARRLFLELVLVREDIETTTRIVVLEALGLDERGREVLAAFVRARLITVDDQIVYITHGALLKAWPDLRDWLADHETRLRLRDRLKERALEWKTSKHNSLLLSGPILSDSLALRTESDIRLGPWEEKYLHASKRNHQRKVRALYSTIAFLIALLVITVLVAGYAREQERNAKDNAREAHARQLIALADSIRDRAPQVAFAFNLGAVELMPGKDTSEHLSNALLAGHYGGSVRTPDAEPGYNEIIDTTFSHDGRLLATADRAGTVALWQITGRHIQRTPLGTFKEDLWHLRFASDNRSLVIFGSGNVNTIAWWDITDPKHPVKSRTTTVTAPYRVSPNGRVAVRADDPWSPPILMRITDAGLSDAAKIDGAGDVLGFSQDGTLMVTDSGHYTLWDISDLDRPLRRGSFGRPISNLDNKAVGVDSRPQVASFSADHRVLAVPNYENTVLVDISDLDNPTVEATLIDPSGVMLTAGAVAFGRTGSSLAVGGFGGGMQLWDASDPAHPRHVNTFGPDAEIHSLTFSPDGTSVATGLRATTTIWNLDPTKTAPLITEFPMETETLAVSADNRVMLTGGPVGPLTVWSLSNAASPSVVARVPQHATGTTAADISNERMIATRNGDDSTSIWDLADPQNPQQLGTIPAHDPQAYPIPGHRAIRFSPDSRMIARNNPGDWSNPSTTELWDIHNPSNTHRLAEIPGYTMFAFSPDGTTLAATRGEAIKLWDVSDPGKPRDAGTLAEVPPTVSAMAFSADGHRLVISGYDGAFTWSTGVWDITDRASPHKISSGDMGYEVLAVDQNSQILIGARGRQVSISPLDNLDLVVPLQGSLGTATNVLLSGDGYAVAKDRQTIRVWDINGLRSVVLQPEAVACALIDPGVSAKPWKYYAPNVDHVSICDGRFR